MSNIELWSVEDGPPMRLGRRADLTEKALEDWIHSEPRTLLPDLVWIGRQNVLPDRSRLDLLGLRPTGEWVVAELKSGVVDVATLTQAMGYALNLATLSRPQLERTLGQLSHDNRDLVASALDQWEAGNRPMQLLLVGTRRSTRLADATAYLHEHGLALPISAITFEIFDGPGGVPIVARNVDEVLPSDADVHRPRRRMSLEKVLELARDAGVDGVVQAFVDHADGAGLHVRPWPLSITVNSQSNRSKTLVYVAPRSGGRVRLGYAAETIGSDFGLSESDVDVALGPENWRDCEVEEALEFLRRWALLVEGLNAAVV